MEILQQKAEPYVTQYGENQIPGAGQLLNSIMRTGTEMVPGVGDLLGAEDLQTAAQNNDWAGIGLGALAAIPGIPAFGRGVRGEARAARGVTNTVADAVPTNQPMTEAEAALARYRAANPNDTGARVLSPGDQGYPTNAQWDEASQAYVAPVEIRGGEIYRGDTRVGRVRLSETGGSLSIDDIEISPSLRSQGIGSDVIRQIQERARQEGRPLTLTSDAMRGTDAQQRQRSLYERLGFQPNSGPNRVSERIGSRSVSPEYVWRGEPVAPVEPDYPIRAYHGSPPSFDRFSLDKIGTGEGAQAYGHGLYFAESEDVARQYRNDLAGRSASVDGATTYGTETPAHSVLGAADWDIDRAIANAREHIDHFTNVDRSYSRRAGWEEVLVQLNDWKARGAVESNPGSMYEVGINADPNTFLDWDRPLSEQSEAVRRALALDALPQKPDFDLDAMLALSAERSVPVHELPEYRAGEQLMDTADQRAWQTLGIDAPHWGGRPEDLPGQDFYRALGTGGVGPRILDSAPQGNVGAAQYLQERGIPGIRYLDANSRGVGEGSRNYVLFNDELVKILRKYGISGLSTTVGASALAEELDRRGQTQEF